MTIYEVAAYLFVGGPLVVSSVSIVPKIYRFVRSKLVKEPETETPQMTFDLFDLPDYDGTSPRHPTDKTTGEWYG